MQRILTTLWKSHGLHRQHILSRSFVSNLFRPFRACKIIRSIQGAAPLATYFAPSGLKTIFLNEMNAEFIMDGIIFEP